MVSVVRAVWYLHSLITHRRWAERCCVAGTVLDSGICYEQTSEKASASWAYS